MQNYMPIAWMALVIVFFIVELSTVCLTSIWLAGGALIACILAALGANIFVQLLAFIIVSFVLLCFTRPIALKYFNPRRVRTNSEELVGEAVKVTERIDNCEARGTVLAKGLEWSARSADNDTVIEKGVMAKVVRIEGVKLIVVPLEDGGCGISDTAC